MWDSGLCWSQIILELERRASPRFTAASLIAVRGLKWQGALDGVGVERAASIDGPWVPIAENLVGLECVVDAPDQGGFFRLRRDRKP
jgi:hypothetical protein